MLEIKEESCPIHALSYGAKILFNKDDDTVWQEDKK